MVVIPNQQDVLFGKGAAINSHPGNCHFRSLVESHKPQFLLEVRQRKRSVAAEIVKQIRDSGGRFLTIEGTDGSSNNPTGTSVGEMTDDNNYVHRRILARKWISVEDDTEVILKVMHRLREKSKREKQEKSGPHPPVTASSKNKEEDSDIGFSAKLGQTRDNDELSRPEAVGSQIEIRANSPDDNDSDDDAEGEKLSSSPEVDEDSVQLLFEEPHEGGGAPHSMFAKFELDLTQPNCEDVGALCNFNSRRDEDLSKHPQTGTNLDQLTHFCEDNEGEDPIEHLYEGTLRQWIERSKLRCNTSVLDYAKSALPIAEKLTACLVEADKDEQSGDGNPIPLASIAAANVLIRAKELGLNNCTDGLTVTNGPGRKEVIDYVSIMSCVGDNPDAGGAMSRLFALGLILYELFSGEDAPANDTSNLMSLHSISLDNNEKCNYRPRKKSQRSEVSPMLQCLVKLNLTGTPQSMCALVRNLLDCGQGDSCSDDAYSSFSDVLSDLQLMVDQPSQFLNNITVNPLPKLLICHKLYGRDEEKKRLEKSYQQHIEGNCGGVIIMGKAGVGKSTLALHFQALTQEANGYFLTAKFDQTQDVHPLDTVGSIFNSLCDLFAQDATGYQFNMVSEALEVALGIQAGHLLGICPSLAKLMPSCLVLGYSSCTNTSMSIQFLFGELLRVVSSHSRRITFFLDDLQWGDPKSLQLIGSLISSNEGSKSVFFICSYRDTEVQENRSFNQWLSSASIVSLERMNLDGMTIDGVNHLISDSLRLSPRITYPLSSVLHHKAGGGNPLFLRQLIELLKEKGYIYVDLSYPKWSWELDKIAELEISDDVVSFLIEEMQKLDDSLQFGLKIASCIGSSIECSVLNILSKDIGQDLQDILQQVSQKGFMNVGSGMCSFSHDKIQQAAYELMSERERHTNHLRFGLAIYMNTLDMHVGDKYLFMSVHQINHAERDAILIPGQRSFIAALNLKAGKRSIELSDINTAFRLFKHGVSFLGEDHWNTDYELSINLFDAVSDAACVLNNGDAVTFYSKQLFDNARCSDDKLNCMCGVIKSLCNQGLHKEAVETSYKILVTLGETLPRPMEDDTLCADMDTMNNILQNTTNEAFLNKEEITLKRIVILMRMYENLNRAFYFFEPSLVVATSLRMIELTIKFGLCNSSPVAFAFYGQVLVSLGKFDLGGRLGRVALKLLEKQHLMSQKPWIFPILYQSIFWLSTPLQSIADAHITGYRAGQQSGDLIASYTNLFLSLTMNYVTGQCLLDLRKNYRDLAIKRIPSFNGKLFNVPLFHLQVCVLTEGLHMLDARQIDNVPGVEETRAIMHGDERLALPLVHVHGLVRILLFRQFDHTTVTNVGLISDLLSRKPILFRPIFLFGLFFEGLVSFQLVYGTTDEEATLWMAKGEFVLEKMKRWHDHFAWNFENKLLLLEAERECILGEIDRAESLYVRSIQSANEHGFIHEEAIASELAGFFFHKRGHRTKSYSLFMKSIELYKKWGALPVARRVESTMQSLFGSDLIQLGPTDDMASIILVKQTPSKRRKSKELELDDAEV